MSQFENNPDIAIRIASPNCGMSALMSAKCWNILDSHNVVVFYLGERSSDRWTSQNVLFRGNQMCVVCHLETTPLVNFYMCSKCRNSCCALCAVFQANRRHYLFAGCRDINLNALSINSIG